MKSVSSVIVLQKLADETINTALSTDRSSKCDSLLNQVDELDKLLNQTVSGDDLKKLRESLGFLARNVAIQIYNKYNDEYNATNNIVRLQDVSFCSSKS